MNVHKYVYLVLVIFFSLITETQIQAQDVCSSREISATQSCSPEVPPYSFYLPFTGLQDNPYFVLQNGEFTESAIDGSASLKGTLINVEDSNLQFWLELTFTNIATENSVIQRGDCLSNVDSDDFYFYTSFQGTISGQEGLNGGQARIRNGRNSLQLGYGANWFSRNFSFGAASEMLFTLISNPRTDFVLGPIVRGGTHYKGHLTLGLTDCNPCALLNGDTDGDGICNDEDCAPNDDSLPGQVGERCDDGDPTTLNDVYVGDGCECKGTFDPCALLNGDTDGDGICNDEDCAPNDDTLPGQVGERCDDGDPTTLNDVYVGEGCDCEGTFDPCALLNGDTDGDGICDDEDCAPNDDSLPGQVGERCDDGDPTTLNDVYVGEGCDCEGTFDPCALLNGDTDGDGICDDEDCAPNDDSLPGQVGERCDDGDPTTVNDVYVGDGCECEGQPSSDNLFIENPCGIANRAIETFVVGVKGQTNPCFDIPNSGNVASVTVELWVAGQDQLQTVNFSASGGSSGTNTATTPKIDVIQAAGSGEGETIFRETFEGNYSRICSEYSGGRSMAIYVERAIEGGGSSAFNLDQELHGRNGNTDCLTLDAALPQSEGTKDIRFAIPIHEKGNTGRPLTVDIELKDSNGGVLDAQSNTFTAQNAGEEASLFNIDFQNVSTQAVNATIMVCSPADNGESFGLGLITFSTNCLGTTPVNSTITPNCIDDISITAEAGANGAIATWQIPTFTSTCENSTDCSDRLSQIGGFDYLGALNGSQYFASSSPFTYTQATNLAAQNGGYLAVICNQEENDFITSHLNADVAWIGFTDEANEGSFVWTNGENCGYTNWLGSDPNDGHNNNQFSGADHTVIQQSSGGWLDRNGGASYAFILEIPCSSSTSEPTNMNQIVGPTSGELFPIGETTVVYEGRDACGNTTTCAFQVIVEETVDPCAGDKGPQVIVSTTNPDCANNNGKITFQFPDHPSRTNIEFSLDGGQTYPLNVSDNVGMAMFGDLAAGSYDLYVRWGNDECPVNLGTQQLAIEKLTPGDVCDDGNTATTNDVIQADGCSCAGQPSSDNLFIENPCGIANREIETFVVGVKGQTNPCFDIPNPGNVASVTVELWVAGQDQLQTVNFRASGGSSGTNTATTPKIDVIQAAGSGEGETIFRETFEGNFSRVCSEYSGGRSMAIYVERSIEGGGSSAYNLDQELHGRNGNTDCLTFEATLPQSGNTKDIQFAIPIHEKGNTGRPLTVDIEIKDNNGDVLDAQSNTFTAQNAGEEASLFNIDFQNVSTQAVNATIMVCSPADNGESFGLGLITFSTNCSDGDNGFLPRDAERDGIADTQDCAPDNPSLPTQPGSICDDGDSSTNGDVIQADGCSCAGTPIGADQCAVRTAFNTVRCMEDSYQGTNYGGDLLL